MQCGGSLAPAPSAILARAPPTPNFWHLLLLTHFAFRMMKFKDLFPNMKTNSTEKVNEQYRDEDEEAQSFLSNGKEDNQTKSISWRFIEDGSWPWKVATAVLAISLGLSLYLGQRNQPRDFYETGFITELQPAIPAIKLNRRKFYGNIIVNSSSQFELMLDPNGERYVGHPTAELDAAWDRIVGSYVALTADEASKVQGEVSAEGGKFFVVPHVRHSLHCINYLRKVAYDKYYPTIRTENKSTVPTFSMHVDHCVEMLRETVQCQGDLTPVPHVWDYPALMDWQDKRDTAWKTGEIHN
ncbi:membrane ptm1 [Trichoderma arundinaceum]|uniref:Membrane ptm1 n=1 Tax=Trichoderma arundinaceum TaxID=490622 RepID=A0A395NBG9_TRIAR|nr:membrane ptm1 [Trichoderma arundinaceum]